eukprot:244814_1
MDSTQREYKLICGYVREMQMVTVQQIIPHVIADIISNFVSTDFYCSGCKCFKYNEDDVFSLNNCGCRSCRICTNLYINNEMRNKRVPIMCLVCNVKEIQYSDIQIFGIDMGLYRKYLHRKKRMRQ